MRDIEVLDVDSGQTPNAFRSGDLVCHVIGDETSESSARRATAAHS